MASVPLSFHAAKRVRENLTCQANAQQFGYAHQQGHSQTGSKAPLFTDPADKGLFKLFGDVPAHYNSKLMNSIWGQYNKDATFNFKTVRGGAPSSVPAAGTPGVFGAVTVPQGSLTSGATSHDGNKNSSSGSAISAFGQLAANLFGRPHF